MVSGSTPAKRGVLLSPVRHAPPHGGRSGCVPHVRARLV